jgi:hypothetical protein
MQVAVNCTKELLEKRENLFKTFDFVILIWLIIVGAASVITFLTERNELVICRSNFGKYLWLWEQTLKVKRITFLEIWNKISCTKCKKNAISFEFQSFIIIKEQWKSSEE